jgi:hypothetical protein
MASKSLLSLTNDQQRRRVIFANALAHRRVRDGVEAGVRDALNVVQVAVGDEGVLYSGRQTTGSRRVERMLGQRVATLGFKASCLCLHRWAHPLTPIALGEGRVGIGEYVGEHSVWVIEGVAEGESRA